MRKLIRTNPETGKETDMTWLLWLICIGAIVFIVFIINGIFAKHKHNQEQKKLLYHFYNDGYSPINTTKGDLYVFNLNRKKDSTYNTFKVIDDQNTYWSLTGNSTKDIYKLYGVIDSKLLTTDTLLIGKVIRVLDKSAPNGFKFVEIDTGYEKLEVLIDIESIQVDDYVGRVDYQRIDNVKIYRKIIDKI